MDQALKLENQLCFKYYVISKEIIRLYKPFLDPLDLTYTSYITMLALWEEDNISIKHLGQRLTLDSGTLTPLLKKLEKIGYIQRMRSQEDERKVNILVTDKGYKLKEKARHIPHQIADKIFGGQRISDQEFQRRKEALDLVLDLLKKD
jgi:DNA-binding MarR family transcriptional regulator